MLLRLAPVLTVGSPDPHLPPCRTRPISNRQRMEAFNQPLSLDTSSVTNMRAMFMYTKGFNQSLSLDTSRVTDMSEMFAVCSCARLIPAQQFCVPTADPHLTPCRIRAPF